MAKKGGLEKRTIEIGDQKKRLEVVIENMKDSYRSFGIEDDPVWKDYPLKGVTYPVGYGFIEGYASEDGHDLDVFLGTGTRSGCIKMWRLDIPTETKTFLRLTEKELEAVLKEFDPIVTEYQVFESENKFATFLKDFVLEK